MIYQKTIKIVVNKYNFPRIRNLPFTIKCSDEFGKIDLVFFNSREGYIRKKLPLRKWVVVSGKINYFNKNYQIVNPEYIEDIKKNKVKLIEENEEYSNPRDKNGDTNENILDFEDKNYTATNNF